MVVLEVHFLAMVVNGLVVKMVDAPSVMARGAHTVLVMAMEGLAPSVMVPGVLVPLVQVECVIAPSELVEGVVILFVEVDWVFAPSELAVPVSFVSIACVLLEGMELLVELVLVVPLE